MLRKFVPNNRGLCSLFGSDCATIVQPERYNGSKHADVFAYRDVSTPRNVSANLPSRRQERRTDKSTKVAVALRRSSSSDVFQARSSVSPCQPRPRFVPRPLVSINGAVEMPEDLSGRANSHRGLGQQPTPDTAISPSDQMVGSSSSSSCSCNWLDPRGLAEVQEQQTRAPMRHEGEPILAH